MTDWSVEDTEYYHDSKVTIAQEDALVDQLRAELELEVTLDPALGWDSTNAPPGKPLRFRFHLYTHYVEENAAHCRSGEQPGQGPAARQRFVKSSLRRVALGILPMQGRHGLHLHTILIV